MLVPERATNRTIAVSGWMLSTLARLGGFPSYRGTPRHVAWLNVSGTMSRFRTRAIENSAICGVRNHMSHMCRSRCVALA